MDYEKDNIKRLTEYIKKGETAESDCCLGLEVEHIIVHSDTKKAVTYYEENGIAHILRRMNEMLPGSVLDDNASPLSLRTDNYYITLEPAAQLEISIEPFFDLYRIREIYRSFRKVLDSICDEYGFEVTTYGYQPADRVADLPLIPKKRYEFMDKYFAGKGNGGIQMMRGTASAQVSIDYTSEEDLIRKVQFAYMLTPMLMLLSDNTPVFEGKKNPQKLRRYDVWSRVDPDRCGIIPGLFDGDFSYKKYAEYLMSVPLIYVPGNDDDIYIGGKTASEFYAGKEIDDKDIGHIMSMVFPDVRIKNFIEIRGADSMPEPELFAYLAFIKGLFLNDFLIDHAVSFIRSAHLNGEDFIKTTKSLARHGWDGSFYGNPADEYLKLALDAASKYLSDEDLVLLKPLYNKIWK